MSFVVKSLLMLFTTKRILLAHIAEDQGFFSIPVVVQFLQQVHVLFGRHVWLQVLSRKTLDSTPASAILHWHSWYTWHSHDGLCVRYRSKSHRACMPSNLRSGPHCFVWNVLQEEIQGGLKNERRRMCTRQNNSALMCRNASGISIT